MKDPSKFSIGGPDEHQPGVGSTKKVLRFTRGENPRNPTEEHQLSFGEAETTYCVVSFWEDEARAADQIRKESTAEKKKVSIRETGRRRRGKRGNEIASEFAS